MDLRQYEAQLVAARGMMRGSCQGRPRNEQKASPGMNNPTQSDNWNLKLVRDGR